MFEFVKGLDRRSRMGLILGAILILSLTIWVGFKVLIPDYRVLFNGLAAQDASSMVEELDKLKVPYKLADDGSTILVDQSAVLQTRMKLMGRDLPLKGAVGFELFNQSDFGMTEFAQRVNYQRALQGELTRTIKSLSQVKEARVMLVLPEKGLFKQAAHKAKASVTVVTDPGAALRADQVLGIQRLVSASAPGIAREDVMVMDQHGVALSREAGADDDSSAQASGRLDLKKETEAYLSRKATHVLEKLYGEGQAVAEIDVVLNPDKSQVTIEDLIVPPGRMGQAPTGVVIREKETVSESGGTEARTGDATPGVRVGRSQREVEYAVGRRVEQVVSQAGAIRKLQAVAVIRSPLAAQELEQVRKTLAAAVGASAERGDVVIVQVQARSEAEDRPPVLGAVPLDGTTPTPMTASPASSTGQTSPLPLVPSMGGEASTLATVGLGIILLIAVAAWLLHVVTKSSVRPHQMTPHQRQATLEQVRLWMAESSPGQNRP